MQRSGLKRTAQATVPESLGRNKGSGPGGLRRQQVCNAGKAWAPDGVWRRELLWRQKSSGTEDVWPLRAPASKKRCGAGKALAPAMLWPEMPERLWCRESFKCVAPKGSGARRSLASEMRWRHPDRCPPGEPSLASSHAQPCTRRALAPAALGGIRSNELHGVASAPVFAHCSSSSAAASPLVSAFPSILAASNNAAE